MIKPDSFVTIHYTAREIDGRLLDATPIDKPLSYRLGQGELPEDIEKGILGLSIGDKKKIILPPEKAFGEYSKDNVLEIPKSFIPDENNEITKGKFLELKDADGNSYRGVVLEVQPDNFVIDFNHPLAGKTIEYNIEIVKID